MNPGTKAELKLRSLGIRDIKDIDIEAIAFDAGVRVEYSVLTGCEATLIGFGEKAIATIRRSPSRGRERFSIGHEVGHWDLHRGQRFRCRVDDPSENFSSDRPKEREADSYSAHILMPSWLFNPVIASLGTPGFNRIREVADQFDTSLIATALRMLAVHKLPVFVACFRGKQLRWVDRSDTIPKRWWFRNTLDDDSFAYDLVTKGVEPAAPRKQPAEVWFENDDADQYEVLEHCVPYINGDILVILYLTDSKMLDARFDPNVGNKRWGRP